MKIERRRIPSNDIVSIGYDDATQTLEIEFWATGVYRYFSVPRKLFDAFLATPNPGRYFMLNVKGKFAWEKVSSEPTNPIEDQNNADSTD